MQSCEAPLKYAPYAYCLTLSVAIHIRMTKKKKKKKKEKKKKGKGYWQSGFNGAIDYVRVNSSHYMVNVKLILKFI